jgi:hypothetical protein
MKMHRYKICLLVIAALFLTVGSASAYQKDTTDMPKLNCLQCHTCEVPTMNDNCLKPCPSLSMTHVTSTHQLVEAPDSLLLGSISEEYQPVHFNHKLHARMAEMGDNCSTCHHYSPPGKIPPCRECHGAEPKQTNLRQPSLKGAYHRHCLSCHREWSHDTKCVLCHLPLSLKGAKTNGSDSTDIIGVSHPLITEPVKHVWETPYKAGPIVTFQHREHIDLFGLKCVNCHKEENCSYCHDLQKPAKLAKTQEEVHAVCNDCHAKDNCEKCHDTKERPGFEHGRTGFALAGYHEQLVCRACHPTGKRITRMSRECSACHAGWNQTNFKHTVTGLKLDEVHIELDCTDCHTDKKFAVKPSCSNCHDDGRDFRKMPPGEYVKRM